MRLTDKFKVVTVHPGFSYCGIIDNCMVILLFCFYYYYCYYFNIYIASLYNVEARLQAVTDLLKVVTHDVINLQKTILHSPLYAASTQPVNPPYHANLIKGRYRDQSSQASLHLWSSHLVIYLSVYL